MVQPRCAGQIRLFRYCDDNVICCQLASDAQRIKVALTKRLAKYGLSLNEEKTKMVDFRKIAGKRASFEFLGFIYYLGKSKNGVIIPKLKTNGKRNRVKLNRVSEWARKVRKKLKLKTIWQTFCSKLRGYINYYAVSHNTHHVKKFVMHATCIIYKWLNRRSQKKSFNWSTFNKYMEEFPLPAVRVYHKLF